MDSLGSLVSTYGWLGVVVALIIAGFVAVALGKLVPGVWVIRWLDDKDKIIDRATSTSDKLADAVEKNTEALEASAKRDETILHALEQLQQAAHRREEGQT